MPKVYKSTTLEIKLGMAMPQVANTMIRLSAHFPRLYADRQPSGMPTQSATITARPAVRAETGSLEKMIWLTVRPRCFRLRPISPWIRLFI